MDQDYEHYNESDDSDADANLSSDHEEEDSDSDKPVVVKFLDSTSTTSFIPDKREKKIVHVQPCAPSRSLLNPWLSGTLRRSPRSSSILITILLFSGSSRNPIFLLRPVFPALIFPPVSPVVPATKPLIYVLMTLVLQLPKLAKFP